MALPQREVKVNGHRYKFALIPASKAFTASRKLTAKLGTILPCFFNKEVDSLNAKITELIMEDFDYLFDAFIDVNAIYCDDKLIADFDEHFAGRFMDIPQLLYKIILENDRDFFHSLPTLIEKGLHILNERLQVNLSEKADGLEEALTQVAQNVKENLG